MRIEFDTDNAAFEDDYLDEVQFVLNNVQDQLAMGRSEGYMFDSNGNRIGHWVEEEV